MTTFIQLSPILITFILLLVFKRPSMQAAIVGSLLSIVLWLFSFGGPVSPAIAFNITKDSSILFLSTAAVIAPGLAFVILIERSGANKAIASWLDSLGWSKAYQVIFIVLGLAPLLESMTGFGVSLIATVPLLLALFPRKIALKIALAGMAIMPWGTLGLATIIGASLADVSSNVLGQSSALVSAPVFLMLTALALIFARIKEPFDWLLMLLSWMLFTTVLYVLSHLIGPEIAGVGAGLSVLSLGLFLARKRVLKSKLPHAAKPYLILLAVIITVKIFITITNINEVIVISGDSIDWQPLSSPGIAIIVVLVIMLLGAYSTGIKENLISDWINRTWKPLTTIYFFLLMSQVLLKGGFLETFQKGLSDLPPIVITPVVAAIASLSGYLTGSNVGGNAIVMPTIANLPENHSIWLMAIQNSGAGHGALGSLSILAILCSLAKADKDEEQGLIRFGVAIVCVNTILVAMSGSLLTYIF